MKPSQGKNGFIHFEERLSDHPFVEKVWRCHSDRADRFISIAANTIEIAVTRLEGECFVTFRGPETRATTLDCPANGEWVCIRFKVGAFMPHFLPASLRDHQDVTLPHATGRSFWLRGSALEYPDFENAESFVRRLIKMGALARDPVVTDTLSRRSGKLSLRSVQRHFQKFSGVTYTTFRQIERARYATLLLRGGFLIGDVIVGGGYFDQAHLTRSLKYYIGETPAKIIQREKQLSFLYNTQRPAETTLL